MATAQRNDPFLNYCFAIEIDNVIQGFAEASGLQSEVQTEDFREGGLNTYAHKIVKGAAYQNLTLKRGMTTGTELWDWHRNTIRGQVERKTMRLILRDHQGNDVRRWGFKEAFPIKWVGPDLKAGENSIAFETLEFAHHGYEDI